jgi:hypothetical protein
MSTFLANNNYLHLFTESDVHKTILTHKTKTKWHYPIFSQNP